MVNPRRDDYRSESFKQLKEEHWCIGKVMGDERCNGCQKYNDGYVCEMPVTYQLKMPVRVVDPLEKLLRRNL